MTRQNMIWGFQTLNKQNEYLEAKLKLKNQLRDLNNELGILQRNIYRVANDQPQEKKKFIMACANEECRGFLSSAYKCELCKFYTCTKCHECTVRALCGRNNLFKII